MKSEGAWVRACREVIEQDMDIKKTFLKDLIDNPGKYPEAEKWTGPEWFAFIFGDYQTFANKFAFLSEIK